MRLPTVLLIGAMKAGTTSLYMDLAQRSDVFLADDKEPQSLTSDYALTDEGKGAYAAHYSNSAPDQLLIDASTAYAKRPDYEGVPRRAVDVLPEGFKIIYLVRHPIDRIVSQHYHEFSNNEVQASIDEAVREHPRFVNYSRYAYQLEPWVAAIGLDRVKVVKFEDYTADRLRVLQDLCDFLGLSRHVRFRSEGKVYNSSQNKPVRNRFWTKIYANEVYRRRIRPVIPVKVRLHLRNLLLPKAPDRPAPPLPATVERLRQQLIPDVVQLGKLLNQPSPWWPELINTSNVDSIVLAGQHPAPRS